MRPQNIYNQLLKNYGPQNWWPVSCANRQSEEAMFEICLGAILTQHTAWTNVEKAIAMLIQKKLISPKVISKTRANVLEKIIKSSGFFRQKTKKLKIFSKFVLDNYAGRLSLMFRAPLTNLRRELLSLWGLGPETVDSMLLYAGDKPVFVIDNYTKRLCQKYGICFKRYDDYQKFFEDKLAKLRTRDKVKLYQEFHALIVRWGKEKTLI